MAEDRFAEEPGPKNSTPAELRAHFFDTGHRLANEAETGSIDKVNKELTDFRNTHSAKEFNALVSAISGANTAHVAVDQMNFQQKQMKELTVPTLILEDSPKDKDKLPDHVAGRIVSSLKNTPAMDALPKVEVSDAAKEGRKRMRDTGNYGFGFSPAAADAAFEDVLNLKR